MMSVAEEHALEAPYLVVGVERGWGTHCNCGWRLKLVDTEEAAAEAGRQHLQEAATHRGSGSGSDPLSRLQEWWRSRRERYRGPDRRH